MDDHALGVRHVDRRRQRLEQSGEIFAVPAHAGRSQCVYGMFSFTPDPIEVPANVRVTFRLTSSDIIHGFQVVGTNANAMAIPGYVTRFTVTFPAPGEYPIACNEYCGLLHHAMVGKLVVK